MRAHPPVMIKTVADFLYRFQQEQEKVAKAQGLLQRTAIGEMYEQITANLLKKAIFEGLDINIVSQSFIKDATGKRSDELDVIIIQGQGQPIELTKDRYDVTFDQVIAVIQVKKTLNNQQLEEGYFNLYSVYEIAPDGIEEYQLHMFNDMYRAICRQSTAIDGKLRTVFANSTEEALYHILKWDAILPARILFAFDGYQTEKGLRDSFYEFIGKNRSTPENLKEGFSPLHFPNLIINDEFILQKNNGLPYVSTLNGVDWDFYTSSIGNPLLNLLEIVWTRLSYRYNLSSSIFGEDLELEGSNPYLSANIVWADGMRGWNYHYTTYSRSVLKGQVGGSMGWSPVQLSFDQFQIINYLCKNQSLKLHKIRRALALSDDPDFNVEDFIASLINTGLVYLYASRELRLLTEACRTIIMPDGNYYAADDKTGRLTRWAFKN